jgi:hypothetical protein
MGAGVNTGRGDVAIVSSETRDQNLIELVDLILRNGYKVLAVRDTYEYLKNNYSDAVDIIDDINVMRNVKVGLVISALKDVSDIDFLIRREAVLRRILRITNIETAEALVNAFGKGCQLNNIKIADRYE